MSRWRSIIGYGIGLFAGVLLFQTSCSSVDRAAVSPPEIEGAEFVGNPICSECHREIAGMHSASPHGKFHKDDLSRAGMTGCESCHGPGSKHVAMGGAKAFIVNPGKDPSSCLECHIQTHAELRLPARHPVIEGFMNCVQCHDPHGQDIFKPSRGLAMARGNETCAECHQQEARPFVFEHEALREGCVVCHEPHGSVNAKMLAQRDSNLCLKCHAQVQGMAVGGDELFIGKVPHEAFLQRGTCWSAGCHTAVHGSNINPLMLY